MQTLTFCRKGTTRTAFCALPALSWFCIHMIVTFYKMFAYYHISPSGYTKK